MIGLASPLNFNQLADFIEILYGVVNNLIIHPYPLLDKHLEASS